MLKLTCSDEFVSELSTEAVDNVTFVTVTAKAKEKAECLSLSIEWDEFISGAAARWAPLCYKEKTIFPEWSGRIPESCLMSCAPVASLVGYDDKNCITVASSDGKNKVNLKLAVIEETAKISCKITINCGCATSDYTSILRIDRRDIPFYEAVEDVSRWWETFPGYESCFVPDDAKKPMYSTWYSYHQNLDTEKLLSECRYFKELGCEGIIVDDGWQTADANRGYASCGDWEVCPEKIEDIKKFSDDIHSLGMKFMLWFSVPFVGCDSKAYPKFKGKTLNDQPVNGAYILDPRYPEVREHIISIYKNAAESWGLDGLKLDFIDCFWQMDNLRDGMDYVSVYDAVDRLMKDIMKALRSVKENILIEFRQSYIGPLMRGFGNIFRSEDCPADSLSNRLNVLSLRQTSGNTAVHSDMIMWHENEPPHIAAYQLTNVLFSVPQISVSHKVISEDQKKMLSTYLTFWNKYRKVILDGKMEYRDYTSNYSFVSSTLDKAMVSAVYSGCVAHISGDYNDVVVVNASPSKYLIFDGIRGKYNVRITDCMGNDEFKGEIDFNGITKLNVPENGYVYISNSL